MQRPAQQSRSPRPDSQSVVKLWGQGVVGGFTLHAAIGDLSVRLTMWGI